MYGKDAGSSPVKANKIMRKVGPVMLFFCIVVFPVPSWLFLLDWISRERPKTSPKRRGVYGVRGFTSGFE